MEVYTHRSGRTGRAGKTGICMSIVHSREVGKIKQIERIVKSQFHKFEIPTGKDVCRKQFFSFMDKLISTDVSNEAYETYVPMLQEKFAEMSKEEILKRVAAMEFDRFLKYYENAEDLNIRERSRSFDKFSKDGGRGDRTDRRRERMVPERGGDERKPYRDTQGRDFKGGGGYTKLFVNLGTKDGFYKASFLQFILDLSDLRKDALGKIDMRELNSWVEVDKSAASQMIKSINGKKFKGRSIRMNEADSRP
jgi:ATP-dependent RNA helicase DeaD